MMKLFKSIKKSAVLAVAAVSLLTGVALVGTAQAACTQYDNNGTATSKTPIFNHFCGVPNGVGNEADFVRIRQNTTGNPTTGNNADYVNALNNACAVGSKFDVRTYVHNGADPEYNTKENAVAVAHNVVLAQTAKLNQADKNFTFTSKITASNAASVTDTAQLTCAGNVVLKLVPSSVNVYSKVTGWNGASDSAVNGTLKLGSRTVGSGDVFACWDDRVIVVYQVVVEKAPTPKPQSLTCDMITTLLQANRTVRVSDVDYTAANGAKFTNISVNWGDGSSSNGVAVPASHTYAKNGTYKIVVTVNGLVNDKATSVSSAKCEATVETKKVTVCNPETGEIITVDEKDADKYKPVGDAACKTSPPTPPELPNTGAGEILGLFAAVTIAGAIAHRVVWTRLNS